MASIDKKWIVTISTKRGPKEFVLFAGLLDVGHSIGLKGITCRLVPELCIPEKDFWVSEATGLFVQDGGEHFWTAYGDACAANSQMQGAYLRHAETRAAARMLRMATNIGMCSVEELGPELTEAPKPERPAPPQRPPQPVDDPTRCTKCDVEMTAREIDGCQRKGIPPHCTSHAADLISKIAARPAV